METIENKNVPKEQTNPNEDDGEERKPDQEKCDYCGVMEQRLYRCARCKKVFYCNRNHQRLHWTLHKSACIPNNTSNNGYVSNVLSSTKEAARNSTLSSSRQFLQTPTKSGSVSQPSHSTSLCSVRDYDMNMDDYTITGSPAIFKLSQDEVVDRETVRKYADRVVHSMLTEGYCVIDNFLGETNSGKVLWDVTNICRSGVMKPGQVISKSKNTTQTKIRGDVITWVTGQEEAYENMNLIMNHVDRLIRYCSKRLGDIKGRTPAMVACYPGDGTGYKRHIDNTTKDGRALSCLYYLNKGWQADVYGGQLRLFPFARQSYVDIEPVFDRFTMFWSDRRTPHQVLPAFHQRFAVTLWYFNAIEREQVKEEYFSKLKNSFAANMSVNSSDNKSSTSKSTTTTTQPNITTDREEEKDEEEYERVPTALADE